MKFKAFTLAEILITLTIIGIVASITIPTLVNNINEQQYRVAWKKAFADLSQVAQKIAVDNGGSLEGIFTSHTSLKDAFKSYLSYTKECTPSVLEGNCWHFKNTWKQLDGTSVNLTPYAGLVLNNGTLLRFYFLDSNCDDAQYGNPQCGHITVDVNGFPGPNTIGKDIYWLHVESNRLTPWGYQGDTDYACSSTSRGYGCSAQYLYQ